METTTHKRQKAEPGDDLKFRITARREDFQLSEDPWRIVIRDQWGRTKRTVTPQSCFYDDEGRFYFTLENVRQGVYYAYFRGSVEDEDYDKRRRVFNDRQVLIEVGIATRRRKGRRCSGSIEYEQVWAVSVDGADYLADCDGRYVLTGDGKRIQFTNHTSQEVEEMGKVKMKMTGDEFLRLMEGKEPNQEVNTIPELMDAMRGISDDKTVVEEIEDMQDENEAGESDIDEIFDDDPDFPEDGDAGQGGGEDTDDEEE